MKNIIACKQQKRCPKCGNETFAVTAHITQTWSVDKHGYFLKTLSECDKVTHSPDDDDIWECEKCGYSAAGSEMKTN